MNDWTVFANNLVFLIPFALIVGAYWLACPMIFWPIRFVSWTRIAICYVGLATITVLCFMSAPFLGYPYNGIHIFFGIAGLLLTSAVTLFAKERRDYDLKLATQSQQI